MSLCLEGVRKNSEKEKQKPKDQKLSENDVNNHLYMVPGYLGTYALDELDKLKIRLFPSFLVVNLDLRSNGGTHWIAVGLFINTLYLCDSLGTIVPDKRLPIELINFLHIHSFKKNLYISKQLQSIRSNTCGKYTICFIRHMCKDPNFDSFLSNFGRNFDVNDCIVNLLYKSIK